MSSRANAICTFVRLLGVDEAPEETLKACDVLGTSFSQYRLRQAIDCTGALAEPNFEKPVSEPEDKNFAPWLKPEFLEFNPMHPETRPA
jgi:hypothetical protein